MSWHIRCARRPKALPQAPTPPRFPLSGLPDAPPFKGVLYNMRSCTMIYYTRLLIYHDLLYYTTLQVAGLGDDPGLLSFGAPIATAAPADAPPAAATDDTVHHFLLVVCVCCSWHILMCVSLLRRGHPHISISFQV